MYTFIYNKQEEVESDNNNKCAVYSVEKGYHNPYIVSHKEDEIDTQDPPSVHEDHIQILVNESSGYDDHKMTNHHSIAGDTSVSDSVTAEMTIMNGTVSSGSRRNSSHVNTAAVMDIISSQTATAITITNAHDESDNKHTNPFSSGVTYHWKSKLSPRNQKRKLQHLNEQQQKEQNRNQHPNHHSHREQNHSIVDETNNSGNDKFRNELSRKNSSSGRSVRVEIEDHTDDENDKFTNLFVVKGNVDQNILSDLEITTP